MCDPKFALLMCLAGVLWAQRLIARLADIDFPSRLFVPVAHGHVGAAERALVAESAWPASREVR